MNMFSYFYIETEKERVHLMRGGIPLRGLRVDGSVCVCTAIEREREGKRERERECVCVCGRERERERERDRK